MQIIKREVLDHFGGNVIPDTEPFNGCYLRETWSNGTVVEKRYWTPVEVPPITYVYLHPVITGGDGKTPIGITNDGVDSLTITMTFRQTADPASAVVTALTGVERNIMLRDSDGNEYDVIKVGAVDGVVTIPYTTDSRAGSVRIARQDVEVQTPVGMIRLVNEPEFLVYRDFT